MDTTVEEVMVVHSVCAGYKHGQGSAIHLVNCLEAQYECALSSTQMRSYFSTFLFSIFFNQPCDLRVAGKQHV